MKRVPFHCSEHKRQYELYYDDQVGGSGDYFKGAPYQKGYGIGGVLAGLFKSALPLIKSGAKNLAKTALTTGLGIAADAIGGQNVKMSAVNRLKDAGTSVVSTAIDTLNRGQPIKRPIQRRRATRRKTLKKKRTQPDVFD